MLDEGTRRTILELSRRGHSNRAIARTLKVSRGAVRSVIKADSAEVPRIARTERADGHREQILELLKVCKGNLVRVHEELVAEDLNLSYSALTAFCRRNGITHKPPQPAGHYHFGPAEEMQHDTSPHEIRLGGKKRRTQTASLVLCYSRILFFQFSPTFRRFECKVFLTEALRYMQGACERCMIDNTNVVVAKGTGADMVPAPEMEAFAERFRFRFVAHEKGHANRSARVERPFHFIENNFLAGREFRDWTDANRRAREWCDKVNATYKKHLKAVPRELYAVEAHQLRKLPLWVPDPYLLHQRIVDTDGYVTIHTNRYSVPSDLIGRRVEVRETKDRVVVNLGPREVACHSREVDPIGRRITHSEHRSRRGPRRKAHPHHEEDALKKQAPEMSPYIEALKKRGRLQTTLALRKLRRMLEEYPRAPVIDAVKVAHHYGLYDLDRLEGMVLRRIRDDYFPLPSAQGDDDDA